MNPQHPQQHPRRAQQQPPQQGHQQPQAYRQPEQAYYEPPAPRRPEPARNGMGTTALVLGILACVLAFIPILGFVSYPLALLGIIFGLVGLRRASKGIATNRGVALAGLIASVLGFVLVIVATVAYVSAINAGVQGVNKSLNAVHNVTYKVTTTDGGKVIVSYTQGTSGMGSQTNTSSPWTQDTTVTGSVAVLTASTGVDIQNPNKQVGITCSIVDKDTGKTVVTNTVPPSGGATVTCSANNLGN